MLLRYLWTAARAEYSIWDPVPFFVALQMADISAGFILDSTIHPTTEYQRTVSAHTASLLNWQNVALAMLVSLAVWALLGPRSFLVREILFPGICAAVTAGKTWLTTGGDGLAIFIILTIGYLAFIEWIPLIIRAGVFLKAPAIWLIWRILAVIVPILFVLGLIATILSFIAAPAVPQP